MELLIIVIVVFLIGKAFGGKKKRRRDEWPDEPVRYAPPRKKGCFSRLLTLIFLGFVLIAFCAFVTSLGGESSDASAPVSSPSAVVSSVPADPTAAPTTVPTSVPSAAPTSEPTAVPTAAPTAEPATLQEWAEQVAQAEYGSLDSPYTDLISVECEQADGESAPMIVINVKYPGTFMRNSDERMSGFLFSVMNVNWKLAELAKEGKIEYGSVFIHGRTTFADQYGNETEGDAAQIRIKASEAAKVNWGYSTVTGDMMPGISASFGIHPIIRDGLSSSYYNKIKK